MLLPRSLTKPTIRYLWGKVATLLWPTMVWLAIYALIVLPATNRTHPLA
ncbi:hypothetical protein [Microbacterium sp.]|jgi:hypothetical protein|nr:hypothetical protein [Microbacterium sp.]